jgi:GTP cyclohydrolase I
VSRLFDPGNSERNDKVDAQLHVLAEKLLSTIFENTWEGRSDVDRTPQRFVEMLWELATPKEFEFTTFKTTNDEMVIIQDIPFVSLCAHHICPFMGVAHIGYVPINNTAGLSKIVRTVEYMSKGLWTQEDLTDAISDFLISHLVPLGTAVVMRAEHTCMTIRGVKTSGALTTTSSMTGCFADHDRLARTEFLSLIGLGR